MIDEDTIDVLRQVLSTGPRRPWPSLTTRVGDGRTEFHFPRRDEETARNIAEFARSQGFGVQIGEKTVLTEDQTGGGLELIVLLITNLGLAGGALVALNAALKAANELPENVSKLWEKVRPSLNRAVSVAPLLEMEGVHRWLDQRCGARNWRYDPDRVETAEIANVRLMRLEEEISGIVFLLAIQDGELRELPADVLPPSDKD